MNEEQRTKYLAQDGVYCPCCDIVEFTPGDPQ